MPTSTIQILVFAVSGTALATGAGVRWSTIGLLAIVWLSAPLCAFLLGYAVTHSLDRPTREERDVAPRPGQPGEGGRLGLALVAVGAGASFVMGSNDVANATGSVVGAKLLSPTAAGAIGGAALALGILTYGRPLLSRVAFEIVQVDRRMATAAQAVQGAVVFTAVAFGLFTSMNQALVAAMAGAGFARGRQTVHGATLAGVVRGWLLGPAAGLATGYLITRLLIAAGAHLG